MKLPEGRDHWHHFRLDADGLKRCHWCGLELGEFREQERGKDVDRQEKNPTQEHA